MMVGCEPRGSRAGQWIFMEMCRNKYTSGWRQTQNDGGGEKYMYEEEQERNGYDVAKRNEENQKRKNARRTERRGKN